MVEETKQISLTTDEITNMIISEDTFINILANFKTDNTSGFKAEIINQYKNGLCNTLYGITINDELINIIVPIFSTENTITWDIRYIQNIKNAIPKYAHLADDVIADLIICPLYSLDKWTGQLDFMLNVKLTDWLKLGYKGRNGFSVYFSNNRIPNQLMITEKDIKSDVFVKTLSFLTNTEIKNICLEYAEIHYKKFAGLERSASTKIKNISNGLYAEIKTFLYLKESGYNVKMNWSDDDDLGVDIQYYINDVCLNIDVKSTKTDKLKISKNRSETDFYAVCIWEKNEPVLLGFLFKFHYWKSEILNTKMPEKSGEMYQRDITEIQPNIVSIDKMFNIFNNYKLLKRKNNTRLFNND